MRTSYSHVFPLAPTMTIFSMLMRHGGNALTPRTPSAKHPPALTPRARVRYPIAHTKAVGMNSQNKFVVQRQSRVRTDDGNGCPAPHRSY